MKKINWYIIFLVCMVSWGLLWMSWATAGAAPLTQTDTQTGVLTPNICPEGQYLDLSTESCRPLHKNFGFDAAAFVEGFSGRAVAVDGCSEGALVEALESLPAAGGIVQLPACTIDITQPLELPSRLILQGAGEDESTLRATSRIADQNMLTVKEGAHVIVRDMTLDGAGHAARMLLAWYADNILFERLEIKDAASSGIVFRYASRVTIRYIESHHHRDNHGIGSKDCFKETLADCEREAGEISTGVLWSQDYAIYSNNLHHNGKYGLDSHASYGEIAGNLMTDNGYGTKFPNASYLWIHHNRIANNDSWGTHLYSTLLIPERFPHNVVFYRNEFVGNGGHPLIASDPVKDVYILRNLFQENESPLLRTSDVVVTLCGDGADEMPSADGTEPEIATEQQCNLANIARLFGDHLFERADVDRADIESAGVGRAGVDSTASSEQDLLSRLLAERAAAESPMATSIPASTPEATPGTTPAAEESATAAPTPADSAASLAEGLPEGSAEDSPEAEATVSPAPAPDAQRNFADSIAVPGLIEAEWYMAGGEGLAYSDSTLENSGEVYRSDDVDVQVTSDDHGEYHVGWIDAGEWLAYSIDVQRAGEYVFTARLRTWESAPRSLHLTLDGEPLTESVEFADQEDPWFDIALGTVSLPAGKHELRVVMETGKFNFNYLSIEPVADGSERPETEQPDAEALVETALLPEESTSVVASGTPTVTPVAVSPVDEAEEEDPFSEAISVPGRIEAELYMPGGAGVGYRDTTLENSGETFRGDDVDVERTSDDHGEYSVGWIDAGEWLAYAIDVQQAGEYELTARLRTWERDPRSLHIELNGEVLVEPVEFADQEEPWFDVALGRVELDQGVHELRVIMDTGRFNFNYLDIALASSE